MAATADLSGPLRAAIVGSSSITALLDAYAGSYPVFTRRPPPSGAPYPLILIGPDASKMDSDGLSDYRPRIERDVAVYGQNDTAAHYRAVEQLGYLIHDLFHRERGAITVSGWTVTQIMAAGPMPAPVDDEQTVGRIVPLAIELAKRA